MSEIRIFKQPQEIFSQNQSFGAAARTYLGKTKFFLPRKRLRFEVKIFLNYHYFGAKIEKSETDLYMETFFLSSSKFGNEKGEIKHNFKMINSFLVFTLNFR